MTNLATCRIQVDGPLSGAENMASDAAMLDAAVAGEATLRFYQWAAPTISLGHFQAVQNVNVPDRFTELAIVQRLSGGGAILHHHELTYSIAIPKSHPIAITPSQLYNAVHSVIIDVLAKFGVVCEMRGEAAFAEKPFLCFGRGDERDIVMEDVDSTLHKIVGSAQRRRAGAILQHGSILLRASEFAPEFPGINNMTTATVTADQLVPPLTRIVTDLGFRQAIVPSIN